MLGLEQIKAFTAQMQTLWEREGILDGQTHIGHTQLSLYTSILELYGTVYDRLRMNQHLNLIGFYPEEPFGFNDLEALVHHRSRVDGDLGTHIPCGVPQGISLRHVSDFLH